MRLWLCGNFICSADEIRAVWEFAGIFDTEAKAVAACEDSHYFVAPVTLNESQPGESVIFPGAYYPHLEPGPSVGREEI